jgi:tetratricopeptide (TPR) repeat protein
VSKEIVTKKRVDWLIAGLLLFGAALRIVYHLLYSSSMFSGDLTIDEQLHNAWALYIADGNLLGDSAFFRAPMYAYFLALLYKIFAANLHAVLLVQHLIGVATGWLIYRVAREMFSYTIGALSLMLYTLTPIFIYFEGQLLLDFLLLPLNLLALLFLCRAIRGARIHAWILSGAFFGLSALTRPNILFVLLFLILWIFFRVSGKDGVKRALVAVVLIAVTAMAVIAPVTVRNYVVSKDLVLISSQGGINFYVGNHRDATGLSAYMPTLGFAWDYQDCEYIAEQDEGRELSPSEVSDYWYAEGLKFILDEPDEWVPLFLKKLYHLVNNHEMSNNRSIPYVYDAVWILPLFPIGVWFLFPFAAVGVFSRRKEAWVRLLTLFVVLYSFTLLMFFINSRFRLPVLAVSIILAALGIEHIVDSVLKKRHLRTAIIGVLIVATSIFTTGNRYGFDFENAASEEFNLGNHLMATGRYEQALARYHLALDKRPDMNQVNLNIGNIHLKLGEIDSARSYYLRELDVAADSVRTYNNLGVVERLAGNDSLAIIYGRQALIRKPYFIEAAVNYVIAARKLRLYEDAFRTVNAAIDINPNNPDLLYYRGVLFFDLSEFGEAETDFRQALRFLGRERQPSFGSVSELSSTEERVTSQTKTEAMIYYSLGTIAGQSGAPDSARIMLEKALELDPALTEAKVNLSSALSQLGRFSEAERICQSLIESGNGNALVWYFVAVSRADAGSVEEAQMAVDSALSFSPNFAPALALKRLLQQEREETESPPTW